MMSNKRASVFDTDDDLDVSGFTPKPAATPAAPPELVRTVSEGAQFQSRDPKPTMGPIGVPKREPRRYRTGRNIQLNIKARTEAIEAFYAIADKQGWVLGEAFERAVDALRRELGSAS
ncbi:MAG: stability/partitioning determinant [Bradyrhizobium sp.]